MLVNHSIINKYITIRFNTYYNYWMDLYTIHNIRIFSGRRAHTKFFFFKFKPQNGQKWCGSFWTLVNCNCNFVGLHVRNWITHYDILYSWFMTEAKILILPRILDTKQYNILRRIRVIIYSDCIVLVHVPNEMPLMDGHHVLQLS